MLESSLKRTRLTLLEQSAFAVFLHCLVTHSLWNIVDVTVRPVSWRLHVILISAVYTISPSISLPRCFSHSTPPAPGLICILDSITMRIFTLLSSPLLPVNTARLPGYWFCPICIKGDWRGAKGERERGGRMETKKGGQQQSPQGFRAHWRQTAGGGGGERGNRGGWGHAVSLSLSVCLLESRLNCQFPPSFSTNATATLSNTTQAL